MTAWLDRVEYYERAGFREVPGPASNPTILKWAHGVGHADYMTDDGSTPWCGVGLAGVMEECGLKHVVPKGPAAAISWLECGVPCQPKPGAIVIFPRPGGNHVTVIKSIDGHTWHCIGGNQSNSICTQAFDGRTARGTRWPIAEVTPAELAANGSHIAAAAQRQKRDAVVSGAASSSTQLPPAPDVPGVRETVDGLMGDLTWAKQVLGHVFDFAAFVGARWQWIALAVALWFGLRFLYDAYVISAWRARDHNEGRNVLPALRPEASR
jgi:uncharacterized protein (TIGR02594 family)